MRVHINFKKNTEENENHGLFSKVTDTEYALEFSQAYLKLL